MELQTGPPSIRTLTRRAFFPPEANRAQFSPPQPTPRGTVRPLPSPAAQTQSPRSRVDPRGIHSPDRVSFQACKLSFQAGRSIPDRTTWPRVRLPPSGRPDGRSSPPSSRPSSPLVHRRGLPSRRTMVSGKIMREPED